MPVTTRPSSAPRLETLEGRRRLSPVPGQVRPSVAELRGTAVAEVTPGDLGRPGVVRVSFVKGSGTVAPFGRVAVAAPAKTPRNAPAYADELPGVGLSGQVAFDPASA